MTIKRRGPNFADQEKQIYRRLIILGVVTIVLIVVLVFWGLPILAQIANILNIIRGSSKTPQQSADVIAPFTPRLEGLPVATNSANLELQGFAEAGSSVEIFLNGRQEVKLLVGGDGTFTIKNFQINPGENRIELRATDQTGNTSLLSSPISVILDETKPSLTIEQPSEGAVFFGQQNQIQVAGSTDSDSTVLINGFWAIVDAEGKFSYNLNLTVGENKIAVAASDLAGNQTGLVRTVFYNP